METVVLQEPLHMIVDDGGAPTKLMLKENEIVNRKPRSSGALGVPGMHLASSQNLSFRRRGSRFGPDGVRLSSSSTRRDIEERDVAGPLTLPPLGAGVGPFANSRAPSQSTPMPYLPQKSLNGGGGAQGIPVQNGNSFRLPSHLTLGSDAKPPPGGPGRGHLGSERDLAEGLSPTPARLVGVSMGANDGPSSTSTPTQASVLDRVGSGKVLWGPQPQAYSPWQPGLESAGHSPTAATPGGGAAALATIPELGRASAGVRPSQANTEYSGRAPSITGQTMGGGREGSPHAASVSSPLRPDHPLSGPIATQTLTKSDPSSLLRASGGAGTGSEPDKAAPAAPRGAPDPGPPPDSPNGTGGCVGCLFAPRAPRTPQSPVRAPKGNSVVPVWAGGRSSKHESKSAPPLK